MNLKETNKGTGPLRLQVLLARSGVASRRRSEELILQGRVRVNGQTVTLLGTKVAPDSDVRVDGVPVRAEKNRYYLAMNKPPGYLCSSRDPQGRSLALELLPPDITERLYTVGRLDYRSSGLIFFTNDGDFAARISHPGSGIEKEYLIEAAGPIPDRTIEEFCHGISIEGETYRARTIERLGGRSLKIVLIEGKNREIRRVFSYFHLSPRLLKRVRIGPVGLGNLEEGKTRPLTEKELHQLEEEHDNRH